MEKLARDFDAPITSPEHRALAESAWLGGPLVSVRFYLGRLVNRNFFRESDEDVEREYEKFIAKLTSHRGAALLRGTDGWPIADSLLRDEFERTIGNKRTQNQRQIVAIKAFLTSPSRSAAELARLANTTEKQLGRMPLLSFARSLPERIRARGESQNRLR